jgi:hypothetical protein
MGCGVDYSHEILFSEDVCSLSILVCGKLMISSLTYVPIQVRDGR